MSTLRTALTTSAAIAGLAVCAAPAGAWTAVNTGSFEKLTLTAAPGELNDPSVVQFDPVAIRITDPHGTPTDSSTCVSAPDSHLLQCSFAPHVVLLLGDKNDVNLTGSVDGGGIERVDVDGQTGNDRITNHQLGGRIAGGSGSDIIRPGLGADVIAGGPGIDAVDYSERTKPVRINFFGVDGSTEQGEQGEGDSFAGDDVEVAFGGQAGDVLIGNGNAEQFIPGPGQDSVEMRHGDDIADLRDGEKDTITCGPGDDTVLADTKDVVAGDCETVSRVNGQPPVSGGQQPQPPTFDAFPVNPVPPAQPGPNEQPAPAGGESGAPAGPGVTPVPDAGTGTGDDVRPKISLAHLSRRSIRRRSGRTTLRFSVSEAAALTVTVHKLVGRKRTRAVKVKTLRYAKVDGVTAIRLTTKLGRVRLGAGRYRLTLVAKDAAGNVGRASTLALRVTRR